MVTNVQFAAVAAYLLWCLCASLSDRFAPDEDADGPIVDESDRNAPVD